MKHIIAPQASSFKPQANINFKAMKFKVKPSQRENWRYIAFQLFSEAPVSERDVISAVSGSSLRLFGEIGSADENLWLIEFNPETKKGILRCSHTAQTKSIAALTAITRINEKQAVLVNPRKIVERNRNKSRLEAGG